MNNRQLFWTMKCTGQRRHWHWQWRSPVSSSWPVLLCRSLWWTVTKLGNDPDGQQGNFEDSGPLNA